jgi:hypothetical protein
MFLRLICENGMKSFENINSSVNKHVIKFNVNDSFDKLKHLNKTFDSLKNTVEVYQSVELGKVDVEKLFKKFSNKSESKYHLLNELLETDKEKSTLYDVYNTLTNYSSHNQRAVKIGKRDSEDYKVETSKKDSIRSNEDRDFEVRNFIRSNTFLWYYNHGLSNKVSNFVLP